MVQDLQTSIFYVDDDQDDLELFTIAARDLEEQVSLFSIGDEMLLAMKNPPPNPSIVFLDLNMPTKDGYQILKEIRSMHIFDETPVVILSTADNGNVVQRCWDLKADMYVTKPRKVTELRNVIRKAVDIDWEMRIRSRETFVLKP